MASFSNQQAVKTAGQKALADQGRAVKQTAVNTRGTAPPPGAPPPAPAQTRDRPFSQDQAAYQQGARPAQAPMPAANPPPRRPVKVGPTNIGGAVRQPQGNWAQAGLGGERPSSLRALAQNTGNFGTHDSTGLAGTQGQYVRGTPQASLLGGPPPPGDPLSTIAGQAKQLWENRPGANAPVDYGVRADGSGGEPANAWGGNAAGVLPWPSPPAASDLPAGGDPFTTLVGQVGGYLGNMSDQFSSQDDASYRKHMQDVYSGLNQQEDFANSQYSSGARQAAEAAARQEMQMGVDNQRMAQQRNLLAGAGRGGAVSQGQGNAINNSAAMAQASGERGLTMDAAERQRQASQDLLNAIQGTTDRRKELGDETYTSRKDLLSLGTKLLTPAGWITGGLN